MRYFSALAAMALSIVVLCPAVARAEISKTEQQKIETLLHAVDVMQDASFVRNGREYNAATATRFLRGKWKSCEDKVGTADDFIAQVASASSTTGKPYLIRFKDGKEIKTEEFFKAELRKANGVAGKDGAE